MKTLVRTANELEMHSLFMDHCGTCTGLRALMKKHKEKYDGGRYADSIKEKPSMYRGYLIWHETRRDGHGKYTQLMCIDDRGLTKEEKALFDCALRVARDLYKENAILA